MPNSGHMEFDGTCLLLIPHLKYLCSRCSLWTCWLLLVSTAPKLLVCRVMNSNPATTSKSLEASPVNYSILRSKYKRFSDKPFGEVRLCFACPQGCCRKVVMRAQVLGEPK